MDGRPQLAESRERGPDAAQSPVSSDGTGGLESNAKHASALSCTLEEQILLHTATT